MVAFVPSHGTEAVVAVGAVLMRTHVRLSPRSKDTTSTPAALLYVTVPGLAKCAAATWTATYSGRSEPSLRDSPHGMRSAIEPSTILYMLTRSPPAAMAMAKPRMTKFACSLRDARKKPG